MPNNFISSYLNFTKKERRGIITLLILILLFTIAPLLFPFFIKSKAYSHTAFENEIAALKIKKIDADSNYAGKRKYEKNNYPSYHQSPEQDYDNASPKGTLFYFDPNTLDKDGWEKLGIKEKTINTIQNYISKGGKFRKPDDIDKIWGLSDEVVARIKPFVKIAGDTGKEGYKAKIYERQKFAPVVVDINGGDTTAFIALPGIGSKLSQRIVNFRERLGGFYSVDQVGETFGLQDSVFQKIKPMLKLTKTGVRQINVNTAGIDELKAHPYIRYYIANAIIQYRTQHGNFTSLSDLKKIMILTDEIFEKASPYLKLE